MWIADLKIVLAFCIYTALAYHGSRQDYSRWKQNFLPKRPATTTERAPVTSANDVQYVPVKLRHHSPHQSRFPNLDRVMVKIDNMQGKKKEEHRVRHQNIYKPVTTTTTSSDGLFGDDYEYDDENEYDELDEENADDYEDNDDLFSDDENEWQAEEATEPLKPVSSLTQYKWDHYGTRAKVEESRRQHLKFSEGRATNAVIEHYMKVRQEGQCHRPHPKVVSVQNEHPNPSKTYTPHCTILHRCAEDTGCCANAETKCGPKTQVPVNLYFYTKTLGVPGTKVENLTFYNHTECACLERNKRPMETSTETHGLSYKRMSARPENIRHCKCPAEFSPKFRYNSYCSCDCELYNHDCIRMKKGKEFFSLTDRRCIQESQCGMPVCEYGVYMRHIGRCQRKQEKLDTFREMTVN